MPYVQKSYTRFRYIAWEVPTSDFVDPKAFDLADEALVDNLKQVTDADARTRLARLYLVASAARNSLASSANKEPDDERTLKILMVPEFYFRKPVANDGTFGTYTEEVAEEVRDALGYLFCNDTWKHWLIVAGTICWRRPLTWAEQLVLRKEDDPFKAQLKKATGVDADNEDALDVQYGFINTVLIQKGGELGPQRVVHKRQPATYDLIPKQRDAFVHWTLKDFFGTPEDRAQNVFDLDGVRFGIEVCADHANKVLVNLMKEGIELNWSRTDVDLHLFVACGQRPYLINCVASQNGFLLQAEGAPYTSSNEDYHQIRNTGVYPCTLDMRRGPYDSTKEQNFFKGRIHADSNTSQIVALEEPLIIPPGPRASDPQFTGKVGYTQRLVVYQPLVMPAPLSADALLSVASNMKEPSAQLQ